METFFRKEDLEKLAQPTASRKVTNYDYYFGFGLSDDTLKHVNTLEDLRDNPPGIIIVEPIHNLSFTQMNTKEVQTLKKNNKYIMSLAIYQQLHFNLDLAKKGLKKSKKGVKFLRPSSIKFKNVYYPYMGEDLTDKTLLCWRTGGIGDLLFIRPNLVYLKKKYPTCTIKFACGPQYKSMVETWTDCIDKVLPLPFTDSAIFNADYHAIFEGVIERCKLAETVNAYNLFSMWLGLDLPDELLIPKQSPKEDKVIECKEILKSLGMENEKFIMVQLRASSPIRTPRPSMWKTLLDRVVDELGYKIFITDSPHHSDDIDNFISMLKIKNKDKVFNFCKYSKSLDYSIAMSSLSDLVIAPDSAFIHIAVSMGIPGFGVYGPFSGNIRLKTYGKLAEWVDCGSHLSCCPCFQHGQYPCKNSIAGHGRCFDDVNFNECIEKIKKLIESNKEKNSQC